MSRYQMREKMFSIGDDYWIEDDNGNRKYKVDGKSLRIRQTFVIENSAGQELVKIQEKKLSIRDAMRIERNGETVATVRKALISPIRAKYKIELKDGTELTAKGNFTDHNYKIERDGDKIAEVSKKWFKVRDTYGIEISEEEDDVLILAAAVCLEEMAAGVVD